MQLPESFDYVLALQDCFMVLDNAWHKGGKAVVKNSAKSVIHDFLDSCGITINDNSKSGMLIYNENTYHRLLTEGSLGMGESYMDKWWDSENLDEIIFKILSNDNHDRFQYNWKNYLIYISEKLFNKQKKNRASKNVEHHYDIGNNLFSLMLDNSMNYSCAYWKYAEDLESAQADKMRLICRKLDLRPGMKVLDIGCGWGGLAKYAAENYEVEVDGVTLSKEQASFARRKCKGLPVKIKLMDYRDLRERYDRIVSVGMFEHVGIKNYRQFMAKAGDCLRENGLFLLHTIGAGKSGNVRYPWFDKYIFPGGYLPTVSQIANAADGIFILEDLHNFGSDYDKTLMAWHENCEKNKDDILKEYDERFYRMWTFYLLSCAGAFRSRNIQLWQVVFSHKGVPGGYCSIR